MKFFFKNLLYIVFLATGFILGWVFSMEKAVIPLANGMDVDEVRQGGYTFINPLLECNMGDAISEKHIHSIKLKIQEILKNEIVEKNADIISLYYRDLDNGPTYGYNEYEKYIPASLLKIPLLITYYKIAERNPEILQKKILFDKREIDKIQYFIPKEEIQEGIEYSVDDLLVRLIKYSDNNAAYLLKKYMDIEILWQVYRDLGIELPRDDQFSISVKSYSTFFRVLYNSSYLNEEYSEKALKLLSKVQMDDGIAGGVPANILVANKFGEFEQKGKVQIHDCGIVYHPDHPYLLCIMTRGNNIEELISSISKISRKIFYEIDSVKN